MNKLTGPNTIPEYLFDDIKKAISSKEYGSVEIYIEAGRVVQITERTIKKTTSKYNSDINRAGNNNFNKGK